MSVAAATEVRIVVRTDRRRGRKRRRRRGRAGVDAAAAAKINADIACYLPDPPHTHQTTHRRLAVPFQLTITISWS